MSEECDEALTNLYLLLDDEMDDELEAARIRAHLSDCPPCGNIFTFEHRLRMVVRSRLQEQVDPAILERIRVVIHQERGV